MFERAYLSMLQSKDFGWRIRNQDLLCYFRDQIAVMKGWSSQQTQEYYEELAFRTY